MKAPVVTVEQRTRADAVLAGDVEVITTALIDTGVAFRWVRRASVYVVPVSRVDRVIESLQRAGAIIDWRVGLW